jgi:protein-disulfide isomerase
VPDVELQEIDVAANPAVAVKYGVMATPAIAIDGTLEFTGVPREDALRARLEAAARRGGGPR